MQFAAVNGWREGCHMDGNLRRSLLAVPASSEKMVEKSKDLSCDQILFDLEDSVAPNEKSSARTNLINLLSSKPTFRARYISVRVNATDTNYFKDDISALAQIPADALFSVVLPKVEKASEIDLLGGSHLVDAQIESAAGLASVDAIASHPRCLSLSYGPLDFAADLGASLDDLSEGDLKEFTLYPLMKILVAARANGKLAFDGPEVDFRNLEKFTQSAKRARALGFDGKWVIHPDQINLCNEIFTPSDSEYQGASELIAKYEIAKKQGLGAIADGDLMIDEASLRSAAKIVARRQAFNAS